MVHSGNGPSGASILFRRLAGEIEQFPDKWQICLVKRNICLHLLDQEENWFQSAGALHDVRPDRCARPENPRGPSGGRLALARRDRAGRGFVQDAGLVPDSQDDFPTDSSEWTDTDGDGIIDGEDDFPLDPNFTSDNDGDGIPDDHLDTDNNGIPNYLDIDDDGDGILTIDEIGPLVQNGDPINALDTDNEQVPDYLDIDSDGDGVGDNTDAFPNDATQWCDEDNDGFGSNPDGNNADDCPDQAGPSTEDRFGFPDRDGDDYSNTGDPFPDDGTQWVDADGDNYGDNPDGNNPDFFPNDASQWRDSDGDGYGDNPGGTNGDRFPNDPTQWSDADNDGYGDNFVDVDGDGISEGKSDVCPQVYGESSAASSRGCPDSDGDGYTDPDDAFPDQPLQWADQDGDGFGDESTEVKSCEAPEGYILDATDCIDTNEFAYPGADEY